jgi:hypothetical protein
MCKKSIILFLLNLSTFHDIDFLIYNIFLLAHSDKKKCEFHVTLTIKLKYLKFVIKFYGSS